MSKCNFKTECKGAGTCCAWCEYLYSCDTVCNIIEKGTPDWRMKFKTEKCDWFEGKKFVLNANIMMAHVACINALVVHHLMKRQKRLIENTMSKENTMLKNWRKRIINSSPFNITSISERG